MPGHPSAIGECIRNQEVAATAYFIFDAGSWKNGELKKFTHGHQENLSITDATATRDGDDFLKHFFTA